MNLPTYQLTNLPTYQLTNLPTYQLSNSDDDSRSRSCGNVRYIAKAPKPQPAMTAANGTAVLFPNSPTSAPAVAPSTNCSVPRSADALPAIAPCGAMASPVVLGMMKP